MIVLFTGNTNNSRHAYTRISPTVNSSRPHVSMLWPSAKMDYKDNRFLLHIDTLKNFEARTFNIFTKIYILRQWKTSLSRLESTDR